MTKKEILSKLLANSANGIITSREITKAGLHRSVLQELVDDGILYQYQRGIYILSDSWEDEFYLLQLKFKRAIFSHETALFLLGYTDRTPNNYTVTFPKGYNSVSLNKENIIIKRVLKDNYLLGLCELQTPNGNIIKAYNIERTLCDILRGNNIDIQIVNAAMKQYISSKNKDIHKLLKYAEQLRVKPKILHYLEVLL